MSETKWLLSKSIHEALYQKRARPTDVARAIGITPSYMSSLKSGNTKSAKLSTCVEIAEYLGYTFSEFVKLGETIEIS